VNDSIPVTRAVDHGTAKLMPDVDRERAWLLTVDGAPQSYVDLDEPTHLEFEYARRLGHVLDTVAEDGRPLDVLHLGEDGRPLDVLHLGGGAFTLPRYLAATRPGSRQDVVEADRGLLDLVARHLPVPAGTGITLHAADARAWLETAPTASADVLVADVFGGSRVPAHLTTLSYAREAGRVLRADGVYLANLADAAPFAFLRSQLATFADVFEHLAVIPNRRCCVAAGSGTPSSSPHTTPSTCRPWPAVRPPTPSPPASNTGRPCASSSATPVP
jgi:hypothetical protein